MSDTTLRFQPTTVGNMVVDSKGGYVSYEELAKAQSEIAALREDAERYRWFRLQGLWDSEHFPWPDGFEYPEGMSEDEMLDAAIDAVRKA